MAEGRVVIESWAVIALAAAFGLFTVIAFFVGWHMAAKQIAAQRLKDLEGR